MFKKIYVYCFSFFLGARGGQGAPIVHLVCLCLGPALCPVYVECFFIARKYWVYFCGICTLSAWLTYNWQYTQNNVKRPQITCYHQLTMLWLRGKVKAEEMQSFDLKMWRPWQLVLLWVLEGVLPLIQKAPDWASPWPIYECLHKHTSLLAVLQCAPLISIPERERSEV